MITNPNGGKEFGLTLVNPDEEFKILGKGTSFTTQERSIAGLGAVYLDGSARVVDGIDGNHENDPGIAIINGQIVKGEGRYFYGSGLYDIGVNMLPGFATNLPLICRMRGTVNPYLDLESLGTELSEDKVEEDQKRRFLKSFYKWSTAEDSQLYLFFAPRDANLLSQYRFSFTTLSSLIQE